MSDETIFAIAIVVIGSLMLFTVSYSMGWVL
jgi:hypothetical protein